MNKIKLKKIIQRIHTAYLIATGQHRHCVVLNLTTRDLSNMIRGEHFEVEMQYFGHQQYTFLLLMETIGKGIDDTEMILEKAKFQSESELYSLSKLKAQK